ncbi:hypothetical protein LINPERPRIM_LOCUS19726 [Linum perenne]
MSAESCRSVTMFTIKFASTAGCSPASVAVVRFAAVLFFLIIVSRPLIKFN